MMVYLLSCVFLFGLVIGSFLNVVILRLNAGESLGGRSRCPYCHALIHWYDNIPLLSFVILKGKCRGCGAAISWQYPAVELATGLLFVMAFLINFEFIIYNLQTITNYKLQITNYSAFLTFIRDIFIISVLIVIFVIDLKWYVIFDIVTLPAAGIVLLANWLLDYDLWNLLISGIIGAGFFLFQYLVSRGKWIGGGDIRLGLLMGFALGWPGIAVALLASYIIGSFVGIGLILSGKKAWGSKVPLGTFLVPGTILALFWGQRLLDWYFDLISLPY